jgi:CDP-2,3-bis-(O-geranylgeranyl)-sn-glycerol synthase
MIMIIGSICFGALFGDITKSFFKRRVGKNRGEDWIPFDQIDFIAGALGLSFIFASLMQLLNLTLNNWFIDSVSIWHILTLFIITPFFHLFANFVHKKLKNNKLHKLNI